MAARCPGGDLPRLLLYATLCSTLSYAFGQVTEVTICNFDSTSKDCNLGKGRDWELHTNLCKDDAPSCTEIRNLPSGSPALIHCPPEYLDYDKIMDYGLQVRDRNMVPMQCNDPDDTLQMAIGIVLLKSNYPEVAIDHYTKLIKAEKDSEKACAAFFFGRAESYAKLGLEDTNNAAHALSDYTKALHAAKKSNLLQIYETRADVFSALGQHGHALEDYTQALKISKSYRLYLMRGITLVFMERYSEAYKNLQDSLNLEPNQITAMHYLTTCLFHMRRFEEAIQVFKSILTLKPGYNEVYESLAQTYREVGNYKMAVEYYNKALISHQTNSILHQRKATLLYNTGQMEKALEAYQTCAALDPFNELCKFMKGACFAGMGQFYPAIKEMIKATSDRPVRQVKGDYLCPTTMYLREWCRYVHSHLDDFVDHFSPDEDLSSGFKEHWSYEISFNLKNYTEQPGLQPHIRDITATPWTQLPFKRHKLLCYAYRIGKASAGQSNFFADESHFNQRWHVMQGLAAVEVAQTVAEYWMAPKSFRNRQGKRFAWRDAFDIAVKWNRFADMNTPIFWMDNPNALEKPYTQQTIMIHHNETKSRYEKYVGALYKLLSHESKAPHREFSLRGQTNPTDYFQYLLDNENDHIDYQTSEPFLIAGSKVASKKEKTQKTLDGCNIILQYDRLRKVTLVYDCKTTWPKAKQYHSELDYLWQRMTDEHKKIMAKTNGNGNPTDSLVNLVLSLTYYFLNLMPLSKSTSSVAYSTAVGLLLAFGRETSGKIPKGRDFFMDAVTTFDPDKFKSTTKSWLSFKRTPNGASGYEPVAEAFPTYRSMLEIFHYDLSYLCQPA